MMLKALIIKVDNEGIHLSPKLKVPIQQTNIPFEHCRFRSSVDIFWKVELIEYNSDTKCWKMKVVDYFAYDIKNYNRQKSTQEVERIAFEKFDWSKFEPHLSSYQKIKLLEVLHNHDTNRFFRKNPEQKVNPTLSFTDFVDQTIDLNPTQINHNLTSFVDSEREPVIKTFKVEFSVSFSDAHFMLGYVTFSKNIKEIHSKVDFKIQNDLILAEFEYIKSWFSKTLKTKKIKVNATITTTDGKVTEATATSPEIAMIDPKLIDSIKYQRTIALTKLQKVSKADKSLYTAEEIFDKMEREGIEGNIFKQNEHNVLSLLLNYKPRNRMQLEYLSESKQSQNSKLQFTLQPNFGFLFFVEGKENNHFVWELLNSHATYIWSIDKSENEIEQQYKRIEISINTIIDSGREQYKRAYRQNHQDSDLAFSVIDHDSISSNLVDGFVKWKHKLNEKTT